MNKKSSMSKKDAKNTSLQDKKQNESVKNKKNVTTKNERECFNSSKMKKKKDVIKFK